MLIAHLQHYLRLRRVGETAEVDGVRIFIGARRLQQIASGLQDELIANVDGENERHVQDKLRGGILLLDFCGQARVLPAGEFDNAQGVRQRVSAYGSQRRGGIDDCLGAACSHLARNLE